MWGHPTCQTPERITWSIPWVISGLERKTFLRSDPWLELQEGNVWPLHDCLLQLVTNRVPTCKFPTFTTSALKIYPHPIWRKGSTRRRTRHFCNSHQRSNRTCPRHCRYTTILWKIRTPNNIHLSYCNFILSTQRHRSSLQPISTTHWPRRNPS